MSITDDIVAIQQLKSEYAFAVDEKRFDDLMDLFTDDIVVDGSVTSGAVWRGKDEVRAGYSQFTGPIGAVDASAGIAHLAINSLVKVDGDTATGKFYFVPAHWGWDPEERGVGFHGVGLYEDEYVRIEGRWRIRRVDISFHFRADSFPKGQRLLDAAQAANGA